MDHINAIVIGGGVEGANIVREFSLSGLQACLLEKETHFGTVISARSSGVIHAGILYALGSRRGHFCNAGQKMLYRFVTERQIPHQACGKLIVATSQSEIGKLEELQINAAKNGLSKLRIYDALEVKKLEPQLRVKAALHVPMSGLIDVDCFIGRVLSDAEDHGALLARKSPFLRGWVDNKGGFIVEVGDSERSGQSYKIHCNILINAAGLDAQGVSCKLDGLNPLTIPQQLLGKGNYFALNFPNGDVPFRRLIYPLPIPGSSGLHYRPEMPDKRRAIWGPDLEWQRLRTNPEEPIDYKVNTDLIEKFETSISSYWPNMPRGKLQPDYVGVRPQLKNSNDFDIQTEEDHGVPGLVCLYGIQSPGITSSMALGQAVVNHVIKGWPIYAAPALV